jgi:hypothetical protein
MSKFSTISSQNRIKVIDSAAPMGYMSHASEVKIAVMSLLTAAGDVVLAVPPYRSKSLH